MNIKPPWFIRVSLKLFYRLAEEEVKDSLLDYIESKYTDLRICKGPAAAAAFCGFQIILMFLSLCVDSVEGGLSMLRSHFKASWRTFKRNKLSTILNGTGMAVSLACGLLLFSFVKWELSYEKCFPKTDDLYRVTIRAKSGDRIRHWATGSFPMGSMLRDSIPEVKQFARLRHGDLMVLRFQPENAPARQFEELGGYFSDPSLFELFDLEFISGNPDEALQDIDTIVLTESTARRYFGEKNPLGQTLSDINNRRSYEVRGVIRDFPSNTHLRADYFISMSTFPRLTSQSALEHRVWKAVYTYLLLDSRRSLPALEAKLSGFADSFLSDYIGHSESYHLQPIRNIHLHSKLEEELSPNSDIIYVYIFSLTAIFILLIAGTNFINISMASAFKRIKEVEVRKVLGAGKGELIRQFLREAMLLMFFAAAAAFFLVTLFHPILFSMTGRELSVSTLFSLENLFLFMVVIFSLGIPAGFYPALFLSRLQPGRSLKSRKIPGSALPKISKGLVVFQFVISIAIIFSSLVINRQLRFFHQKDLGYQKDSLLAVSLHGDLLRGMVKNWDAVRIELLQSPVVKSVGLASQLPGQRYSMEPLRPRGISEEENLPSMRVLRVDQDYIETLGLKLLEGRNFELNSGNERQFILNQSAVSALDLENPVGIKASGLGGDGEIVGVIADFHFASLHHAIEPLVLSFRPQWTNYLLIRFFDHDPAPLLSFLQTELKKIDPGFLFRYFFLDEHDRRLYQLEGRAEAVFQIFSTVAIMLSCLGLLGLSMYSAERRVKEIGIRRVLGASSPGIFMLLSRRFLIWVITAHLIAWPAAFFLMSNWLRNFAFRVDIGFEPFLYSFALSFFLALGTVSYRAAKAAFSNPVESLRHE